MELLSTYHPHGKWEIFIFYRLIIMIHVGNGCAFAYIVVKQNLLFIYFWVEMHKAKSMESRLC
jgi:hypothetical protein